MSAQALFAAGQIKARYKSSGVTAAPVSASTGSVTSLRSLDSTRTKRTHAAAFATPVSVLSISTPTLNVSAVTYALPTLTTSSSPTLAAVSTGNAPGCLPFWTPSVAALSQKLWWPIATASHASAWSSWSGYSNTMRQDSWFSTPVTLSNLKQTNSAMTYSPSLLSSWLATTEGGSRQIASDAPLPLAKKAKLKKKVVEENAPSKPSAGKARRIRVYPNPRQKALLLNWFGTARWTFNKCLDLIKTDRAKRSKKDLRAQVINAENYGLVDTWVLETPYEVRDAAMVDLLNAYNSNFAKRSKNTQHQFEIHYRSKKTPQEAIMIRGKLFKKGSFYTKFFGREALRSSEPLPDTVAYDCKLLHTRLGHYYLVIPMPLDVASDSQARVHDRVIALDPGVRTFHTAYDPSGSVIEFGKADIGHIYRICAHMDKLQSRIAANKNIRHKSRYRMRRAWRKMQWRVRNLIDECHKKIVHFLCSNYSVILLPSFKTQAMVRRCQRKITSKTARAMMTWSHYRFKQRLLFKCQEFPWCKVVICSEAFTSKTCGQCGTLHHSLGRAKVFRCAACGLTCDRDMHAARNILLKNASLFGFTA